jgi:predicted nicotinamide N-methyase
MERQRLLCRIGRRFATATQTLRIGPLEIPFTRVADPNRVLDEVVDAEDRREKLGGERHNGDELHLPYWAELWDSAYGLASFLTSHLTEASRDRPPEVLDLGCGMGLTGTVAAARGCRVTFADLEPPALLFARLNSLPYRDRVRTRRLNWRTDTLGRRFNLILGADILYERPQWDFLDPFWRNHLAPNGSILLGEPGRPAVDAFPDWVTGRGWRLTQHEQPIPTRPKPIRLFELQ